MNPLDEKYVQVSVVPLLGTAACHGTKCDVHLFTLSHAPEAHYVKLTPLILASSGHRRIAFRLRFEFWRRR